MDKRHWITPATMPEPLRATIRVPGDKSISHRAAMLGGIAQGETRIQGFLSGEDTRATLRIMGELGVQSSTQGDVLGIHGTGLHGLRAPPGPLDCGNAGTGMRLLAGLLSAQSFATELTGDASLSKRPMQRIIEPLRAMGARIESEHGRPPLRVGPSSGLKAITYHSPVASAQVKSAVLLAGLYAQGTTRVEEPRPTRDYTERMLQRMGAVIEYGPGFAQVTGGHPLQGVSITVPGDFSSAAFLIVLATLVPGSNLRIEHVGLNPTRTGLLHALSLMGANLTVENMRESDGDRVGDITVRHAELEGAEIPAEWVPDMIDEFPVLFAAAAMAQGVTTVTGAAELRVKESDRIAAMVTGLQAMGVDATATPDGAIIRGGNKLRGAEIDSHGDHRIAMSFAVLAAAAGVPATIRDVTNVDTSFPGFADLLKSLGIGLQTTAA